MVLLLKDVRDMTLVEDMADYVVPLSCNDLEGDIIKEAKYRTVDVVGVPFGAPDARPVKIATVSCPALASLALSLAALRLYAKQPHSTLPIHELLSCDERD